MSLFQRAFHIAHMIHPEGGACLEFGVYEGRTYLWQARQILSRYPNSSLIGFDSWSGLPEETNGVWAPERHARGGFAAPKELVVRRLRELTDGPDERFSFVDGFFGESLTDAVRARVHNVIFINLDVDLHRSTLEVLEFLEPLWQPGLVVCFDDWKDPADDHAGAWGEHRAFTEWLAGHGGMEFETLEVNLLNQRSMVVTRVGGARLRSSLGELRYRAHSLPVDHFDRGYEEYLRFKGRLARFGLLGVLKRLYRGG
jgi:methyltransferase family protein